jgi:hypothetical protein
MRWLIFSIIGVVLTSGVPGISAGSWDELWGFSLGYIFPMPIGCNQWSLLFSLASETSYAVTKICSQYGRSTEAQTIDSSGGWDRWVVVHN